MDTRILITGANGYVGKSLYNTLKNKYNITCTSRKELNVIDLKNVKEYFKNNYGLSITSGEEILTWWSDTLSVIRVRKASCKVTRKHTCTVKREKPSAEGFYQWLYKQIEK